MSCGSVFSKDVYDKLDYLSSLGKTQIAAVQRDADIGVAEAERDAGIRVRKSSKLKIDSSVHRDQLFTAVSLLSP